MIASRLYDIPSWGNLTLIELLWLVPGVLALAFAGVHLRPLYQDYELAKKLGRRVVYISARGYYRREWLRFFAGAIITSIGVYSAFEPPARPGPAQTSLVGIILTAGLIGLAAKSAVMSWLDWRDRSEAQAILLREADEKEVVRVNPQDT